MKPIIPITALLCLASLLTGVLLGKMLFSQPKNLTLPAVSPIPTQLPETSSKLIYTNSSGLQVFNLNQNKHYDLRLSPVVQYLWSSNGQLAALVQGKYGADLSSYINFPAPVHATTDGFNYLLYLVDLDKNTTSLLDSTIFGDVFWSSDSTGLFISEHYFHGQKLLLGSQIGEDPDQSKYFFLNISPLRKSLVTQIEFNKNLTPGKTLFSPENKYSSSPDNKFIARSEGDIGQEFIIIENSSNGNQLFRFPGKNPSWEPLLKLTTYTNYTYGFQVSLPPDWSPLSDDGNFTSTKGDYQFSISIVPTAHKTIQAFLVESDQLSQTAYEGQPITEVVSTKITRVNNYSVVQRREKWLAAGFLKPVINTYLYNLGNIYSLQLKYLGISPNPDPTGESDYNSILSSFKFTN